MVSDVEAEAAAQYGGSTANLDARVAIHAFGTSPIAWAEFVRQRLPLVPEARVLDVGAGTGVHWQRPTDAALILMDLHGPMCERLSALGHPVMQASVDRLPIRDEVLDGVVCTHVLYHADDPGAALDELVRVLRPGGWIALASNGSEHMQELMRLAWHVGATRSEGAHDRFTIDDAVSGLVARGMQPRRHDFDDDLHVTDPDAAVSYVRSMPGELAEHSVAELRDEVVRQIADQGSFLVRKETALVLAYKPRVM